MDSSSRDGSLVFNRCHNYERMLILTQSISSPETRAVHHAINLLDGYTYANVSYDDLDRYTSELKSGAVPVGSVEFVTKAMELAGIEVPSVNPYPPELQRFLHRTVEIKPKSEITAGFVKPTKLKQFTGFVLGDGYIDDEEVYASLPLDTNVWHADAIGITTEVRYYIDGKFIRGIGRYDDTDDIRVPSLITAQMAVTELNLDMPYVLDFGIMANGETVLIEYNDFWAIGYYKGSLDTKEYLRLLVRRWKKLSQPN